MSASTTSTTEENALALLGTGIAPEVVAATLGISASRISQLLSDENFAARVAELRYESLVKHNKRDDKYDQLEDDLLKRMENCIGLMYKPMEILKAIQVINAAKRRGASAPDTIQQKQQIITLNVPTQLIQKFQTTVNMQVINTDGQELVTIQSNSLDSLLKDRSVQNGSDSLAKRIPQIESS